MNLDRLEQLLETMSPSDIRTQFVDELAQNSQCEALLTAFESMDEQLVALKTVEPAPNFHPPGRSIMKKATLWALPLAAVVVLGLLFGSGFLSQKELAGQALDYAKKENTAAESAPGLPEEIPVLIEEKTEADRGILASDDERNADQESSSEDFDAQGTLGEADALADRNARAEAEAPRVAKAQSPKPALKQDRSQKDHSDSKAQVESRLGREGLGAKTEPEPMAPPSVGRGAKKATTTEAVQPTDELQAPQTKPQGSRRDRTSQPMELLERELTKSSSDEAPQRQVAIVPEQSQREEVQLLSEPVSLSGFSDVSDQREAALKWLTQLRQSDENGGPFTSLFTQSPRILWQQRIPGRNLTVGEFERVWRSNQPVSNWDHVALKNSTAGGDWLVTVSLGEEGQVLQSMRLRLNASGLCELLTMSPGEGR